MNYKPCSQLSDSFMDWKIRSSLHCSSGDISAILNNRSWLEADIKRQAETKEPRTRRGSFVQIAVDLAAGQLTQNVVQDAAVLVVLDLFRGVDTDINGERFHGTITSCGSDIQLFG